MKNSIPVLSEKALMASEKGDHIKAADYYREALKIAPDSPSLYYNLALELDASGNTDGALNALSQALEYNSSDPDIFAEKGRILLDAGEYEEAEENIASALKLDPEHPYALNNMGVLSFLKKEYDDALIYFLDAVKVKKDFADAWFNLADTYSVIGDDRGEKAARKKFEKLNER